MTCQRCGSRCQGKFCANCERYRQHIARHGDPRENDHEDEEDEP